MAGGRPQRKQGNRTWRGPYPLMGTEGARRSSKRAGAARDGKGQGQLGMQLRLLFTCLPELSPSWVPVVLIYGLRSLTLDVLEVAGRTSWCCFFGIVADYSLRQLLEVEVVCAPSGNAVSEFTFSFSCLGLVPRVGLPLPAAALIELN